MEAERSIVLQKKTILFLSLIIGAIFGVIYAREVKMRETSMYLASLDVITVNVPEDENEILRENVKYLMAEEIIDDEEVIEVVEETIEIEEEIVEPEVIESKSEIVATEKPKTVRYRDLAENNPPEEYERIVEASATAYCLCKKCCGKSEDHPYYGYTRSGLKITKGTGIKVIAVDPNVIPLNTKVYVEGLNGSWDYGHAIAADTGSAIKELKIDLYMDTHEEALQWGRRKVNVYVLGE